MCNRDEFRGRRTVLHLARAVLPVLAVAALSGIQRATPALAVEGISYTLSPAADFARFNDDLGLKNSWLYGGRLSLNFGRYAALAGYYELNQGAHTRLQSTPFPQVIGVPLADQDVDLRNYGGEVVFNLRGEGVIPFLQAGGGVMRLDPAQAEAFKQIGLRAGGGLRFDLMERLQGLVYAEDLMFRMDRARLLPAEEAGMPGTLPVDPDRNKLRHNLLVGAGVSFFLGGYQGAEDTEYDRAFRSALTSRPEGLSIPIEPFAGRVDFAHKFNLPRQDLVGFRTGVDFGPLFGLRGYYWRGVNSNFDRAESIQSWGGEAQYNLGVGPGVTPFLLVGAGALDFRSGYRDELGRPRADKAMLIGGGGLNLNVGQRLRVSAAVRDYIASQDDLDQTSNPNSLIHNVVYTAGLNFSVGGRATGEEQLESLAQKRVQAAREEAREEAAQEAAAREQAAREQAAKEAAAGTKEKTKQAAAGPQPELAAHREAGIYRNENGQQSVSFPVPTEGEIYIRYGNPGGVTIRSSSRAEENAGAAPGAPLTSEADLRAAIRQAIREELGVIDTTEALAQQQTTLGSQEQMELLERRIEDRVQARLDRELAARRPQVVVTPGPEGAEQPSAAAPSYAPAAPAAPPVTAPAAPQTPATTPTNTSLGVPPPAAGPAMQLSGVQLYSGIALNDPIQFMLGTRLDFAHITADSPFHFVPELGIGVSDNSSYMVAANVKYESPSLHIGRDIFPYFGAGIGVLGYDHRPSNRDQTQGVLNITYGFSKSFGNYSWFLEHEGIDLFSINRILLGITLNG